MIRKWIEELLAEVGLKLPERKKRVVSVDIETVPYSSGNKFDPARFDNITNWEVRWKSRSGDFSSDVRSEVAGFTSKETATEFAQTLKDAHKMLRNTNRIGIGIYKVTL